MQVQSLKPLTGWWSFTFMSFNIAINEVPVNWFVHLEMIIDIPPGELILVFGCIVVD